jgi:hypothetical protein
MADINPTTTFHCSFTEKEYNLVMMALALVGGAAIKPDSHHRAAAIALNQSLLQREKILWQERITAVDKKIEKAPKEEDNG